MNIWRYRCHSYEAENRLTGEQEHMIVRGARLESARFHMSLIEMCYECLTS